MPIQSPQWTDFLFCPICCNEYNNTRYPISLACGHTVCKLCLYELQRKECPFDQTEFSINVEHLPVNHALLQLVSSNVNSAELAPTVEFENNISLSPDDVALYVKSIETLKRIALFLKPFSTGLNTRTSVSSVNVLSRPMQKKIVALINCQLLEPEGRQKALKATRSLGERIVTELTIHHQNPQQLSTNLWAAVRARGCQFLGPAMQEEVLKLILLALEDGSALSRKVLVMFVVQRLEPHFPQASKTSVGHVVQLLYRASCFAVSKREGDSSLMRLKEEYRSYEALRRAHDAQIVEISMEAGLRIAPDQWSALLYGDITHKSHMQSVVDKAQTFQSFSRSVHELVIAVQKTANSANLTALRSHLLFLAGIDVLPDENYTLAEVLKALESALQIVTGFVDFSKSHSSRKSVSEPAEIQHGSKYKISMCRDLEAKGICTRGTACTFAHSEQEMAKYRVKNRKLQKKEDNAWCGASNNNDVNAQSMFSRQKLAFGETTEDYKSNCSTCEQNYDSDLRRNCQQNEGTNKDLFGSTGCQTPGSFAFHDLMSANEEQPQTIHQMKRVLCKTQSQQVCHTDDPISSTGNYVARIPVFDCPPFNRCCRDGFANYCSQMQNDCDPIYGVDSISASTSAVFQPDLRMSSLSASSSNPEETGESVKILCGQFAGTPNQDVPGTLLMGSIPLHNQFNCLKTQLPNVENDNSYDLNMINNMKNLEITPALMGVTENYAVSSRNDN